MKRIAQAITLLISICLASCATSNDTEQTNEPKNLSNLQNLSSTHGNASKDVKVSRLREQAIQETALTLGAQSGLAWRAKQINANLEKKSLEMQNIFNFNALMLDHGVQPPVLIQANNTLNYDGPNTLRISDKTYKIAQQAKFVTTAPNWRNYLWMDFKTPEEPNQTLLPRNREEQIAWKKYITIGWNQGINQANTIFQENLAKLRRDYSGMLLYRDLLAKHMISKPYVATTNLGVTGDKDSIHINDQVLRITSLSQLQTDSAEWQPIVVK